MPTANELPSIAFIGAGKVALTVATLAQQKGYPVTAIAGRDLARTKEAAGILPDVHICSPEMAAKDAQIVFLSVSDDAIESVCAELAEKSAFSEGQIVAHFSGAHSSENLFAARDKCGALVASVHPLQTFSTIESAVQGLPGTFWFCEGDDKALAVLTGLIVNLGGQVRLIPTDKKVLYHATSVVACNYLVTLMDIALSIAESASLERELAWQALSPLIQATIRNINSSGTTTALTGPIARGDVITVTKHLRALSSSDKEAAEIYKLLGLWTTKIAQIKGLSLEQVEKLKLILSED